MSSIVWKQSHYGYRYAEKGVYRLYVRPKTLKPPAEMIAGHLGYRWSVARNGKTVASGFCWDQARAEEKAAQAAA
jgi:hypothetical protein